MKYITSFHSPKLNTSKRRAQKNYIEECCRTWLSSCKKFPNPRFILNFRIIIALLKVILASLPSKVILYFNFTLYNIVLGKKRWREYFGGCPDARDGHLWNALKFNQPGYVCSWPRQLSARGYSQSCYWY